MKTGSELIKAKALELGFTKVGIATAEPLEVEGEHLKEWLDRSYHGSMAWMAQNVEKRIDPTKIVPGAQSVIVLALNYYTNAVHKTDLDTGKISRYAWGDDYHFVLKKKLRCLWQWMQEEFPGIDGRYYVDTGPVMEKAWAQRAGIGWIGKHTNLITEDKGSWLFLAVIISTLELDPDGQATDHCGTCTLCLEACPTGAITEAYVVDSNRCLSYLTIEHRGTLEASLAEKMDGWIYGCDICQDVCPWNEKFAIVTDEPSFLPRDGNLAPSLRQWSEMTEEEFRTMSRGSPMTRTKYSGLIRNVRAAVKRVSAEFEQPNP